MATVYLAIQVSFEREVALKVMAPALSADPAFGERFIREARIVSRLVHPNIVTVYDVGVHEDQHFLSMEYVPGRDLKQKRFRLSHRDTIRIVTDVARALDFAGRKGYVHRDVKPENIMLHEEDGRAVLMDFGIARPTDVSSGMTQTGTAIGTPHYMSPEQAKGKAVDRRSDLYSLGVVLYLLLVGRVPFDADSAVAVGIKHVAEPIPRLPAKLQRFQAIVDRILAKDPQQRYQTGAELIADLSAISERELDEMQSAGRLREPVLGNVDTSAKTVLSNTAPSDTGAGAGVTGEEQTVVAGSGPVSAASHPTVSDTPSQSDQALASGTALAADVTGTPATASKSQTPAEPEADIPAVNRLEFQQEKERSTALSWLAGMLVATLVGGFVYLEQYHPQQLQRWLQELRAAVGEPSAVVIPPDVAEEAGRVAGFQEPAALTEPAAVNRPSALNEPSTAELPSAAGATSPAGEPLPANQGPAHPRGAGSASPDADSPAPRRPQVGQAGGGPLAERVRDLRRQLEQDLSVAPELAQIYRDVLRDDPDSQQARWGLQQLREFHWRQGRQALEQRNLPLAQRYLDSARASFADAGDGDERYQRLSERLQRAQRHRQLIDEGNGFLAKNALGSPAGANALQRFRAVLAEDGEHPLALQGLNAVAARYADLGERQLQRGDIDSAQTLLQRGLAIRPDDSRLLQLADTVTTERRALQQRQQQLVDAREMMAAGQLIAPAGESAFDRYRAVLAVESDNVAAQRGLQEIERRLAQRLSRQIDGGELDAATEGLRRARERFNDSPALQPVQVALDLAFEARALAGLPKIPRVVVSNSELTGIGDSQAETLAVDRTIYIGFRYQNFMRATSVVQAILYDGARSLQIAQVPVIVSGGEGVTFFRIDRPVEGFAEGGYHIDLLLGGDRLTSAAFKVESARVESAVDIP